MRTNTRTTLLAAALTLLLVASACAADGAATAGDTAGLESEAFVIGMQRRFVLDVRQRLGGAWGDLSDEQLVRTGVAYCDLLPRNPGEIALGDKMQASALAVGLLADDGVGVGYDASGTLDETSFELSAVIGITAKDSLCTWVDMSAADLNPPGTSGAPRGNTIAGYIQATGMSSEVMEAYVNDTQRFRVDPSAERRYVTFLESMSAGAVDPIRISRPEDEDALLTLGYTFCIITDTVGKAAAESTWEQDVGIPLRQAIRISLVSAIYLCPEYFSPVAQGGE